MMELLAPIARIDKAEAKKIVAPVRKIANRVALKAMIEHGGEDIFLYIYMAGLYHGQQLAGQLEKPE